MSEGEYLPHPPIWPPPIDAGQPNTTLENNPLTTRRFSQSMFLLGFMCGFILYCCCEMFVFYIMLQIGVLAYVSPSRDIKLRLSYLVRFVEILSLLIPFFTFFCLKSRAFPFALGLLMGSAVVMFFAIQAFF